MGGDRTEIAVRHYTPECFILHETRSQYPPVDTSLSSLVFVACKAASPFCIRVVPKGLPPRTTMAFSYKMKGIFKGFKIISQIFAAKEPEMEIGCPTDVKHVAHIGWSTSTGTLTGNAPLSWMNSIGGSSDFGSLGNLALAAPSAGTSWASQDFEPRDVSPLGIASEITGQQDAAAAPTCGPDVPRPPKKTWRGRKRTATDSLATSLMPKDSSVSASAADAAGTSDTMQ
ncbi:hypothetical protein ACQ4PT_024524 [Festuca glaucescens]